MAALGLLKGSLSYLTLDAALAEAEAGVARWMRDELGIKDATMPGSR